MPQMVPLFLSGYLQGDQITCDAKGLTLRFAIVRTAMMWWVRGEKFELVLVQDRLRASDVLHRNWDWS